VSHLAGKLVLVTRPADQAEALVTLLKKRGAVAVVAPAIKIAPVRSASLTRALKDLSAGEFEWMTLTSQATVQMLGDRLESPHQVRAKVAAIGDGTAVAFKHWARRKPDLLPAVFTTAALARAFPRGTGRVLCARADIAPPGLEDALAAKGWSPTRVDAYRTSFPRALPPHAGRELERGNIDAITFTSASSVRGFVGALRAVRGDPKVVCIGSVTAAEARARGLRVAAVAKPHTMEGIVEALERVFTPRRTSA
jgi:uroporphyrinogen-III synthase